MKTIEYSDFERTQPLWMGDAAQYENYIPGGARLRRSSVTGTSKIVRSGSLVGRTANAKQFELIAPTATKSGGNFVTTNNTTLIEPTEVGATLIRVADTDGFSTTAPNNAITIGAATATIVEIRNDGTMLLNAGLVAAYTAGTVVRLTTATPFVQLFLTATEMTDVEALNEFTQYRHGRMIYLNFLPNYATFSADVLASITGLYHHIFALA